MKTMSKIIVLLVLLTTSLFGVIVTDYPDPFDQPNALPQSYYVPDPVYYQYGRYPQGVPPPPYYYDGFETQAEEINRDFRQREKNLFESDPYMNAQKGQINQRVLKQQNQLRERSLKQQEALHSY